MGAPVSSSQNSPRSTIFLQALGLVGEPVLVNDQPGVEAPVEDRGFDVGEHQLRRLLARRETPDLQQEIGGRIRARDCDP